MSKIINSLPVINTGSTVTCHPYPQFIKLDGSIVHFLFMLDFVVFCVYLLFKFIPLLGYLFVIFRPNGSIGLTLSLCQSVRQSVSEETLVPKRQSKQFTTATAFKLCFLMGRIEPLTLGTKVSNNNH